METQPHIPEQHTFFSRNKNLFKGILIAILILALLIPTYFISDLIDERQARNETVKQEIAKQWSQTQTVCGPILMIPFLQNEKDDKGKDITTKSVAYFMPDKLNINGTLFPEIKSRSIFKVPIYSSQMEIKGNFAPLDVKSLSIPTEHFLFSEAKMIFGISDMKGLQEQTQLNWDQKLYNMNIGDAQGVSCNGVNSSTSEEVVNYDDARTNSNREALVVAVPIDASSILQSHSFEMKLNLRGTEKIFFTPVGTSTKVSLAANWQNRDFQGNYVPDSSTLNAKGFAANWNIYRSMQPTQKHSLKNLERTTFGVNLIQPLDNYGKTNRTIKYAILVIMLTFVVYFFIEVFQKKNVHAIQYILIGFALCIFYTLLLSISEYMSFPKAYITSALATIILIGLYTKSVFDSMKTAGIFSGFLSMLYAFIFILIQLQDGALLAGSIGLFIILAAIMYFSRKIEWHGK